MMRRQVGQYGGGGDSGVGNAYAAAPMHHHMRGQRVEHKPSHFEERLEAFTPERDNSYGTSKPEGQWRWEGDGSKGSNPMATSQMFNDDRGGDTSRSYFQGQRPDPKLALEKQSNNDSRSQPHIEDMDRGYEDKSSSQTFEDLEQKFLDDIKKVVQEQCDAEDKEISRHREKIGAINGQYEEQLTALRARHAKRRDELLRRESNARQQQYQQTVIDRYPNSSMVPSDLHGYGGVAASATVEPHRGYNTDQYESYSERARFLGGSRDHGFEPRGPYPGGRVYDTGSRYY